MKIIKFDLPINGTKVRSLEELRNNCTTEILELYSSGVLLRWLKCRNLTAEVDKMATIAVDDKVDKFVAICEILGAGKIEVVEFCAKIVKFRDVHLIFKPGPEWDSISQKKIWDFKPSCNWGDLIEAGNTIGNIYEYIEGSSLKAYEIFLGACGPRWEIKSPLRGVFVGMCEISQKPSIYREGVPIFYIRIDQLEAAEEARHLRDLETEGK